MTKTEEQMKSDVASYIKELEARLVEKDRIIEKLCNIYFQMEDHYKEEVELLHQRIRKRTCNSSPINIVFDGPPGPKAGRFVEIEKNGEGLYENA